MINSMNCLYTEDFGEDDSENYHFEFLATNGQPATSTQKPLFEKPHIFHTNNGGESSSNVVAPKIKFNYSLINPSATQKSKASQNVQQNKYQPYNCENSSSNVVAAKRFNYNNIINTSDAQKSAISQDGPQSTTNAITSDKNKQQSANQSGTTTTNIVSCTKCKSNEQLILANTALLKTLIKEVKYLRRDQQNNSNQRNTASGLLVDLNLRASVEQFQEIEEQSKNEEYEQALIKKIKKINDQSLDKYVRACLNAIVTNEVARSFSWFGQDSNIAVKSYNIMKYN